jgi:hypothetical protein
MDDSVVDLGTVAGVSGVSLNNGTLAAAPEEPEKELNDIH